MPRRTLLRRFKRENVPMEKINGPGGLQYILSLPKLPSDIQSSILIYIKDQHPVNSPAASGKMLDLLPVVSAAAASTVLDSLAPENPLTVYGLPETYGNLSAAAKRPSAWNENSLTPADLENPKFRQRMAILRDMETVPAEWEL